MVFLIHFSIVSSLNFASLLLTAECNLTIYISGKIFSSKTQDITGYIKGFSSQSGISSVEKQQNQHSLLAMSNLEFRHTLVFLLDSKLHKEKRFTNKCNYEP